MSTPQPRSFSLVRLLLAIAVVGAVLAVARLLHPDSVIPAMVVGVALGILVLIFRRGDWPAIGHSLLWCLGGALVGCSRLCLLPEVRPNNNPPMVMNAVMGAIIGWVIGLLVRYRHQPPDDPE